MLRRRRSAAAFAVALVAIATSAWTTIASTANASSGPGCEAGAPCPDSDGDGFVMCGCAPPGAACDCDDRDPSAYPGAPERCDSAKDLDCDGLAGSTCGDKRGCLAGMCVMQCPPLDDFGCGVGNRCEQQPNGLRLCAGPDCTAFGCLPGFTCGDSKVCVPDCTPDVKCPFGQRCRGTNCTDPCASVTCGPGSTCHEGQCVAACDCFAGSSGCAAGEACDRSLPVPRCVEQACSGIACASGLHCAAGTCVDDCAGVVCPPKLVCEHVANDAGITRGECVDLCPPGTCPVPKVCEWHTGSCQDPVFPEAGLVPVPASAGDDDLLSAGGAGITCNTHGLARASATGALASALSFALLLAWRVRRRRR
jgi:hypothetical protein